MAGCPACGALLDGATCSMCSYGKPVADVHSSQTLVQALSRRTRHHEADQAAWLGLAAFVILLAGVLAKLQGVFATVVIYAALGSAVGALVLGVDAVRRLSADPSRQGRIAAWAGVVIGGLFVVFFVAATGRALWPKSM